MQKVVDQFDICGRLIYCEPFGSGHINVTYAAYFAFENYPPHRYIVQQVNTKIFTEPKQLVENVREVTSFLQKKVEARGGDPLREVLTMVESKNGTSYYQNEAGDFFRVYRFIENATCYQTVTKELFYESARAFGRFAKELDGFDATKLYDIIEKFHHTVNRYENLQKAVEGDKVSRVSSCEGEIAFVQKREGFCSVVLDEIANGNIPLRVCHNDTKLNNVMIDNKTQKGLCVIDLDTIMKGSLLYDFGDSIRFGASSALEDEENLDQVYCDLEKYEMYVQGYLEEVGDILSKKEFELLAEGAILMTFEVGMRFLTDHLEGDVYFRIHKENHNLIRARNQFKLVADMEEKLADMKAINQKYK